MWARLRDWWLGPPLPPPPAPRPTPVEVLRRLQLTTLRPLAELLGGDERSRQRGSGMVLSEVRAYQPGDDIRFIDWNITARTDETYVREATVERALDVWMVIDTSRSLAWGTATCLKRDRAEEFVAAAAVLAAQRGHRTGALFFAERPLGFVPSGAGRPHLLRLLAGLRQAEEAAGSGVTELGHGLRQADALLQRHALVLVVSDFLASPGWQPAFSRLAQRHEVIAIRLSDPRELALPDVGLVTLEDPETGQQLLVDTGDAHLRERFREAASAQEEALRHDVTRYGAEMLELRTDEDLLPPLRRMLFTRRLRRAPRAQSAHVAA